MHKKTLKLTAPYVGKKKWFKNNRKLFLNLVKHKKKCSVREKMKIKGNNLDA